MIGRLLLVMLLVPALGAGEASAAVIPVTSLIQKISANGGCSLQEAIYSANFDNNVAIAGYSASAPLFITTGCVPGSGDDIIVLPAGAVLRMAAPVVDAANPTGPTATPLVDSTITIVGFGATLERLSSRNFRLFAVGTSGRLTIRRTYIRGFRAQGGNGADGGGGGLGAGGAIYVMGGVLAVEASTFDGNGAFGGTGGSDNGGGGGGMGGHGSNCYSSGAGGGGGAGGTGGGCTQPDGSGGGGSVSGASGILGGYACGGRGGHAGGGQYAPWAGGGGGGGGDTIFRLPGENGFGGGRGAYGGGGGGGTGDGSGGGGGFGGGASGLAGFTGENGGNGGFGGGGGAGNNGLITDGDPGNGGFLAGNGSSSGGGGGAGLGGAIFNDSGTVEIRNSTFAHNVTGGGLSERTQDGASGGGAIFSVNGHLTVVNATISLNLAHIGGGILVAQTSTASATSIVLHNSIVADNGLRECAITGESIGVSFAGNLIMSNADGSEFDGKTFVGCQGVVTSDNPNLGPLQNNDGPTPTMAIAASSPASNAADPATSLPVDQRRQDRPAMGGFDIGAFELCLEGFGKLQRPCPIIVGADGSGDVIPTVQLTVALQPAAGGTTVPAPGTTEVAQNSVIPLKASPAAGYRFDGWSSNVASPSDSSTTIFMDTSQTVTATFAACMCATDVTSAIGVTYGGVTLNPVTRRYVQTVTVRNNSTAAIAGPISLVLDDLTPSVTLYNPTGKTDLLLPANSPYVNLNTSLAVGQTASVQLQVANPGNVVFTYRPRILAGTGSR